MTISLIISRFSPRKRRCFSVNDGVGVFLVVFSAQAEVFLEKKEVEEVKDGFLRVSGGVSSSEATRLSEETLLLH